MTNCGVNKEVGSTGICGGMATLLQMLITLYTGWSFREFSKVMTNLREGKFGGCLGGGKGNAWERSRVFCERNHAIKQWMGPFLLKDANCFLLCA